MRILNKEISWPQLVFAVFVTGFALIMLINPQLGTAQDDFKMIRTLQIGLPLLFYSSWFPYDNLLLQGRFTPLSPMEYNFFGLFMKSPSAFWYFLFHAFEYALLTILFVKILSQFTSNKLLIYFTPILLSLTPAVTIPFFRTHITDKHLALFYLAFFFFFSSYLKKPKLRYLILGVICVNMAVYFKEIAFVVPSVFVFCYLLLTRKRIQPKTEQPRVQKPGIKIFSGLVMLSSLVYLLIYYFFVRLHLNPDVPLYGYNYYSRLLAFIKNIFNYGLFSDPIILFILLPFVALRIYKFLRRKTELHPIYDSMLISASVMVLGYLAIGYYTPQYMLPVYVFTLPPLIYFFSQKEQRTFYFKTAAVVSGLIILLNVFPAGIHYLTYYKYLPINYDKTLDFLVQDINSRYPDKRASIFLYGIDPKGGGGIYFMDSEFLQYKGLAWDRFDLKSNEKVEDNTLLSFKNFHPPFSVFQDKFYEISKGDYLIVSPRATKVNVDRAYIQSLLKDYDLIFKTSSPLAFPSVNLKTLAKYLLSEKLSESQEEKGVMINKNLMNWPDYYVLVKK
ncbi:MAG: hypothetical protein WC475_00530 [Candidatus Paceibacterota bacterium]